MPFFGELHPRGAAPRCPPSAGPRDPQHCSAQTPTGQERCCGEQVGERVGGACWSMLKEARGSPCPKIQIPCAAPTAGPCADSCGQGHVCAGLSSTRLCQTTLLNMLCRELPGQDRLGTVSP